MTSSAHHGHTHHGTGDDDLVLAMRALRLRCPNCLYDLCGATDTRCPECGRVLTWKDFQDDRQMPGGGYVVMTYLGLVLWIVALVLAIPLAFSLGGVFGAGAAVLPLLTFAALLAALWLLFVWWRRPGRLLTLGAGARRAVTTTFVIPGAILTAALMVCTVSAIAIVGGWLLRAALG